MGTNKKPFSRSLAEKKITIPQCFIAMLGYTLTLDHRDKLAFKIRSRLGCKPPNVLPTIQPLTNAKNAEMQLQVMLTKGESVKGNAQEGMSGNYFERKVKLIVK